MSATGGFWPGEAPAAQEEDEQEPEAAVADPPGWPEPHDEEAEAEPQVEQPATVAEPVVVEAEPAAAEEVQEEAEPEPDASPAGHVPGELDIPEGVAVLEGSPSGADRTVGVVVSRFNGEISNRLLESALEALAAAGVAEERITVMPVPGAFELPIGAMALAKTRRYSCVIALGCVVRGETAHFDYVAGEAASGLQLAGLETGVPVAFGVLTVDTAEQAEARVDKGADAARAALEMADLFSQVRKQARAG
ncbi:MAG TPA: 6,7-dimethyl-8-ribityllumazine synthase [Gaiellaceae bacterium]|nr:6,7-dimethyl-8-ribityllumazine synthase [Gaiellaceae bacterium]